MNRSVSLSLVLAASVLLAALGATPAFPQESAALRVSEGAVCIDVVDLSCVGVNAKFPIQAGTIYCFSRVLGATDETHVTHVWYYEEKEKARIDLEVRSGNWRTYSAKRIFPSEIGHWRVSVLDPAGGLLMEIPFEITSQ